MAVIDKDTRLIMTILFVGTVSGANVYFYANYGSDLPWTAWSHAVLFGLITVGAIMGQKALFDLAMNERMELWFLDRKLKLYWERKQRDAQQRQRLRESMRQYQPMGAQYPQSNEASEGVSNDFLASIEQ